MLQFARRYIFQFTVIGRIRMSDTDLPQFIELLAACPSLSTLAGRELVIKDLKFAVPRSHGLTDKQDIAEIARTVRNYPDGCARLWEVINFYEGDTVSTKNLTEFLQQTGQLSGAATTSSQPAKHNMPFGGRDHRFTGRETQLAELRRTLLDGGAAALVVTKGQGGVGKTSLAREYAYRHISAYKMIGWLDAETSTSLMTSFSGLARLLGLAGLDDTKEISKRLIIDAIGSKELDSFYKTNPDTFNTYNEMLRTLENELSLLEEQFIPDKPYFLLKLAHKYHLKFEEEVVRKVVLERFESLSDWLLIYDNADDPAQLKEWLPKAYTGHILMTSRAQNWQYAKPLTVPLMLEAECLALLLEWLERPEWHDEKERSTAAELCNELGYLTLAVAQAGAYIKAVGISVADYLTLFKEERLALFEEDDAQLADRKDKDNVAATYGLNVKRLEETNPTAHDLLNLLAFFAPEPFRLELLKNAIDELPESLAALVKSPLALNRATAEIRRYSLATIEDGKINLHRLVAMVIRERYLDMQNRKNWATNAVNVCLAFYPANDVETYFSGGQLLNHAFACTSFADGLMVAESASNKLRRIATYIQNRPGSLPLLAGSFTMWL
jgi:hypothetical protein